MAKMIAAVLMIPRMLRSLRCHDGDDEQQQRERQKKATRTATVTGLDKKRTTFPCLICFTQNVNRRRRISLSNLSLDVSSSGTQLQESSPTLNVGEKVRIIALKSLLKRRFRCRRRCCMLQSLLFQRPWRPLGNQPLQLGRIKV